jgi:hypothetical protein
MKKPPVIYYTRDKDFRKFGCSEKMLAVFHANIMKNLDRLVKDHSVHESTEFEIEIVQSPYYMDDSYQDIRLLNVRCEFAEYNYYDMETYDINTFVGSSIPTVIATKTRPRLDYVKITIKIDDLSHRVMKSQNDIDSFFDIAFKVLAMQIAASISVDVENELLEAPLFQNITLFIDEKGSEILPGDFYKSFRHDLMQEKIKELS